MILFLDIYFIFIIHNLRLFDEATCYEEGLYLAPVLLPVCPEVAHVRRAAPPLDLHTAGPRPGRRQHLALQILVRDVEIRPEASGGDI